MMTKRPPGNAKTFNQGKIQGVSQSTFLLPGEATGRDVGVEEASKLS